MSALAHSYTCSHQQEDTPYITTLLSILAYKPLSPAHQVDQNAAVFPESKNTTLYSSYRIHSSPLDCKRLEFIQGYDLWRLLGRTANPHAALQDHAGT